MSVGWIGSVILSGVAAAALTATTLAATVNSHAQAPKSPEYHKTWQDGALRKPLKKGLKAKGGNAGDDAQHLNFKMQERMGQHSQARTTQSGVAKKQDETKKGMVKKMK